MWAVFAWKFGVEICMLTFCEFLNVKHYLIVSFILPNHQQLAALALGICSKPAWGSIDLLSVRDAWTLNLPHTPAPSCLPESFVELKSYNTWICWRSWLKSSGHASSASWRSFVASRWRPRGAPRFRRRSTLAKRVSSCNISYLPWKSSRRWSML